MQGLFGEQRNELGLGKLNVRLRRDVVPAAPLVL